VIEPDALMEMGGLNAEQVEKIVGQAEVKANQAERAAAEQRRQQREQDRLEAAEVAEASTEQPAYYADGRPADEIEQPSAEQANTEQANTEQADAGSAEALDNAAESSDDAAK
jgi:transcription termination/antitermination protein NusA